MTGSSSSFSLEKLLIVLVLLWLLQGLGAWYQARRYVAAVKGLQASHHGGYLGSGHVRRRLAPGSIVLIVADMSLKVTEFKVMRGFTIFANFVDMPEYVGLGLAEVQQRLQQQPEKSSLRVAGLSAVDQILRVKRNREEAQSAPPSALAPA